jgi:hypothetical protein
MKLFFTGATHVGQIRVREQIRVAQKPPLMLFGVAPSQIFSKISRTTEQKYSFSKKKFNIG